MPKASMKKQTFWNEIRVKANCRYSDIADLIGRSQSFCSMLFSGELMPVDKTIEKLCDFFDVDFDTGKREFEKAHREWVSIGRGCGKQILATGSNAGYKRRSKLSSETVVPTIIPDSERIAGLIYGKLSFESFNAFMRLFADNADKDTLLQMIYCKVNYTDFMEIQNIIETRE